MILQHVSLLTARPTDMLLIPIRHKPGAQLIPLAGESFSLRLRALHYPFVKAGC